MLEKIKAIALEKCASEAEYNAFMEGFEKEAISFGTIYNTFNQVDKSGVVTNLLKDNAAKAGVGLAAGLAGAAIVYGLRSAGKGVSNGLLRSKFETALTQVMNTNRVVRGADPVRAKQYADTIFSFAPHVAADPNLLSSILANAVQGEGIDVMTVKTLTELEGRYKDNNSQGPLIGIKS
jgi:hypothetical protein